MLLRHHLTFCFGTEVKKHKIPKSDDASVEFCFTYLKHLREVLVSAVSKPNVTQTYFIWGVAAHLSLISKGKSGGGEAEVDGEPLPLPSVMGPHPSYRTCLPLL